MDDGHRFGAQPSQAGHRAERQETLGPGPTFDVVGIGAINYDYIIDVDDQPPSGQRAASRWLARELESTCSDAQQFNAELADLYDAGVRFVSAYGGSAFNALRALAHLDVGLDLGFLGAVSGPPTGWGTSPRLRLPASEMETLGIDITGLAQHPGYSGACLSVLRGGTRRLWTLYDASLPSSLPAPSDAVRYLAMTRLIHVTSLFGADGPKCVADLVVAAKASNPDLIVSVDPGLTWARSADDDADIRRLLTNADILFLNPSEMGALAPPELGDDQRRVGRIRSRFSADSTVVVWKDSSRSIAFRPGEDAPLIIVQSQLADAQVADATGSGDVFAGGVLAGLMSDRGRLASSILMGNAAARLKLQYVGNDGYAALGQLIRGRPSRTPGPIFISHSHQDLRYVDALAALLAGMGVPVDQVFCTSVPETSVHIGVDLESAIFDRIPSANLFIAVVSLDYAASDYCKYELGAARAHSVPIFPVALPGYSRRDAGPLLGGRQQGRLTSPTTLNQLRKELGIRAQVVDDATWAILSRNFLSQIRGQDPAGAS